MAVPFKALKEYECSLDLVTRTVAIRDVQITKKSLLGTSADMPVHCCTTCTLQQNLETVTVWLGTKSENAIRLDCPAAILTVHYWCH